MKFCVNLGRDCIVFNGCSTCSCQRFPMSFFFLIPISFLFVCFWSPLVSLDFSKNSTLNRKIEIEIEVEMCSHDCGGWQILWSTVNKWGIQENQWCSSGRSAIGSIPRKNQCFTKAGIKPIKTSSRNKNLIQPAQDSQIGGNFSSCVGCSAFVLFRPSTN